MFARFQPDSSAFFIKENLIAYLRRNELQDAFAGGQQNLRMNPMRNFTQLTRFHWRKRAAVFD
jgi:hypothetical protein